MTEMTVGNLVDLATHEMSGEELLNLDNYCRAIVGKPLARCTERDLVMIQAGAQAFAGQAAAATTIARYVAQHLEELEAEVAGCRDCRVIIPNGDNGEPAPMDAFAIHIPAIGCARYTGPS